jgi:hypothetical protein
VAAGFSGARPGPEPDLFDDLAGAGDPFVEDQFTEEPFADDPGSVRPGDGDGQADGHGGGSDA